jgi:hypothetical protein
MVCHVQWIRFGLAKHEVATEAAYFIAVYQHDKKAPAMLKGPGLGGSICLGDQDQAVVLEETPDYSMQETSRRQVEIRTEALELGQYRASYRNKCETPEHFRSG